MAIITVLRRVTSNKILSFVMSRYATYFIQFINSLFIAIYLGPYYLGIWGFINLIIQYLSQFNLGIANAALALGSLHKKNKSYITILFNNAFTMIILLSTLLVLIFVFLDIFKISIGGKYNFSNYLLATITIGILNYFISLFSNLFRIVGKLNEVAISQSLLPLIIAVLLFFFKGQNLLELLVYSNLLAFCLAISMFIYKLPVKIRPSFNIKVISQLRKKGLSLFLYNASFYLITISTRSFISAYYTISEFGIFTFAFSLASIILLLLESFSFLLLPKAINKFANSTIDASKVFLDKLRHIFIGSSHLLVHISCLVFPVFLFFFPKYNDSLNSFRLIALSIVIYTNTFGYQSLLISKGLEKKLSIIAITALFTNLILLWFLIIVMNVQFYYVISATLISYNLYCVILAYHGNKILTSLTGFKLFINSTKSVFSLNWLLPYLFSIGLVFFGFSSTYYFLPLFLYVVLNYEDLKKIKTFGRQLLNQPNTLDI